MFNVDIKELDRFSKEVDKFIDEFDRDQEFNKWVLESVNESKKPSLIYRIRDKISKFSQKHPLLTSIGLAIPLAAAGSMYGSVVDDNNDPDNDGIPTHTEMILGSDPNIPSLFVEIDYHETGFPVYKNGDIVNTVYPYFNMSEIDLTKVRHPHKSYFSEESVNYLVDYFKKNGIELFIDNAESNAFLDSKLKEFVGNRGGQLIEYPVDDIECGDYYTPPIENPESVRYNEEDCYAFDPKTNTNHYSNKTITLPPGRTPWITYDQAKEFYNNPEFFGENRKGIYHYMIIGGSNVMSVNKEGELALGLGSIGSDLSIVATEYSKPKGEVPVFLHELGHNFGLKHSDDPNNVMYERKNDVMNYTKDHLGSIKSVGLKESLSNQATDDFFCIDLDFWIFKSNRYYCF